MIALKPFLMAGMSQTTKSLQNVLVRLMLRPYTQHNLRSVHRTQHNRLYTRWLDDGCHYAEWRSPYNDLRKILEYHRWTFSIENFFWSERCPSRQSSSRDGLLNRWWHFASRDLSTSYFFWILNDLLALPLSCHCLWGFVTKAWIKFQLTIGSWL